MSSKIQVGGLYATKNEDGTWGVVKVLAMDEFAVHLRSYANKFEKQPTSNLDPDTLTMGGINDAAGFGIGHFPLAKEGFLADNPVFLKVVPVTEDELEGYRIYLEAMGGDPEAPLTGRSHGHSVRFGFQHVPRAVPVSFVLN